MTTTIGQTVEYILANRRGNAFKDLTYTQIAAEIIDAVARKEMLFATNECGALIGIVVAITHPMERVVMVCDILCTERWVMQLFVAQFRELYPGWRIEAQRRGRHRRYDTERLTKHILNRNNH